MIIEVVLQPTIRLSNNINSVSIFYKQMLFEKQRYFFAKKHVIERLLDNLNYLNALSPKPDIFTCMVFIAADKLQPICYSARFSSQGAKNYYTVYCSRKNRNQFENCGFFGCIRFSSKIFANNEDFGKL